MTAGRFVEPFTSTSTVDCEPGGPKFSVKYGNHILKSAERAEKLLKMSRSARIEALGLEVAGELQPSVVLNRLCMEELTSVDVKDVAGPDADAVETEKTEPSCSGEVINQAQPSGVVRQRGVSAQMKRKRKASDGDKRDADGKAELNVDGEASSCVLSASKQKNKASTYLKTQQSASEPDGVVTPRGRGQEKRKRKASDGDKRGTDGKTAKHGKQLNVDGEASSCVISASTQQNDASKYVKTLQSASGESPAVDDATVSQANKLQPGGTVTQRGRGRPRATSFRNYKNVGNRAPVAADSQKLVADGDGFTATPRARGMVMVRARGRGSVGFSSANRDDMAVAAGARSNSSARRPRQRGMPIRGRARMNTVRCPPNQEILIRNSVGVSGDGQMNGTTDHAHGVPHTPPTGASAGAVQILNPTSNSASADSGEGRMLRYFTKR